MNTLLISYDLGVPETSQDYLKVINYIKSFPLWAHPLQSVWIISTDKKIPSDIVGDINALTDSNDKLLVIDISNDNWCTIRISDEITNWMKKNI